jgi:seryl-tRNA synthetase
MLDLKSLEKDPATFEKRLGRRGLVPGLPELLELSRERKSLIAAMQVEQEQRNASSKALAGASKDDIDKHRLALRELGQTIKDKEVKVRDVELQIEAIALTIPNVPRDDVPSGNSADDNVEVRRVLEPRTFDFPVKDHVDIGERLGILNFERAAKISGARFAFLQGAASQLNRALLNFLTDYHVERGDLELTPPLLVKDSALRGTGQFPKFVEDTFRVPHGDHDLYLIPTAEVPVTNYFADEILEESQLPMRFCAYSACFRAEAGAAGRDTRGLIRQHQFEKVEMVRFATPAQANDELEAMVERASDMLTKLELPHRVVVLCTGDMGFQSEKTYDIEVWLPGQNSYREISSCSSCGSFQARRAQIRYRAKSDVAGKPGRVEPLVTLNGSGLPLGRTLVAILENHQNADGSVNVPEVLRPYMRGVQVIDIQKAHQ